VGRNLIWRRRLVLVALFASSMLHAPRSTLHAPCSVLHAPCSMLRAPCSTLHAPCFFRPVSPRSKISYPLLCCCPSECKCSTVMSCTPRVRGLAPWLYPPTGLTAGALLDVAPVVSVRLQILLRRAFEPPQSPNVARPTPEAHSSSFRTAPPRLDHGGQVRGSGCMGETALSFCVATGPGKT